MSTIWVTGDIHGNPARLSSAAFPEQKNMTREDVVEVLGDFGLVWDYKGESKSEKYWLDWLEEQPFTTVATLGNHENYDRIEKMPVEEHFGASVWVVRPHVFLLQSGYVYEINGKKIWNFNGASSHDISDGIIDSPDWENIEKIWEKEGKDAFRIKGVSWWPQEIETNEAVYDRGIESLKSAGYDIDFIWTHCAPAETARMLGFYEKDRLCDYLQTVDDVLKSLDKNPQWFFGHYHINRNVAYHKYLLFDQIIRIG